MFQQSVWLRTLCVNTNEIMMTHEKHNKASLKILQNFQKKYFSPFAQLSGGINVKLFNSRKGIFNWEFYGVRLFFFSFHYFFYFPLNKKQQSMNILHLHKMHAYIRYGIIKQAYREWNVSNSCLFIQMRACEMVDKQFLYYCKNKGART